MTKRNEYLFGQVHSHGHVATDRNQLFCNASVWSIYREGMRIPGEGVGQFDMAPVLIAISNGTNVLDFV